MKQVVFLLLIFSVLLVSCSSGMDEDVQLRVDILYEHTIQMEELSSEEVLNQIGLDMSHISRSKDISAVEKIQELESSYGMEAQGDINERIEQLEEKMNEMMEEWARIEYDLEG